jgi:hypothetical protein
VLVKVRISVKDLDLLGNASSVDENIDLAVVGSDILNGLLNSGLVTNVDLVETDVDTSLSGELLGRLLAKLLLNIEDGNALDTNFREGLSHVVTESTAATVNESQ